MDELLKVLQNVIDNAQALCVNMKNAVTYANNITKEAEAKIKTAEEKEAQNTSAAADLTAREEKVARIENIVKLEADGRALKQEAEVLKKNLDDAKTAFSQQVSIKLGNLAARERKYADDMAMLKKEWAAYHQREADLKVREDNYKERIARGIIKNAEGS